MVPPSNETSCPEKRLLVCCARTRIQPAIAEEIREILAGPIDWDFLLFEAGNHSVTPLLCRQLISAADLLDPDRLEQLKQTSRAFAMRNLVLSAELIRVVDRLRSEGVYAIPYKGAVLASQAYGDIALREFEDLDIILRQGEISKANEAMVSLGYLPKYPWVVSGNTAARVVPAEYIYRDEPRRMMVELHTELTLRHFPVPPDIDDLATRLTTVSVSGHDVRTFAAEDMLLLLCVHGSKHFWEQLSWIADIAEFVQVYPNLDWSGVLRRADTMRARRMLAISLALARDLFGCSFPAVLSQSALNDSVGDSIAAQIERRLLARAGREPDAFARFHLRRQMLTGWAEGWRYSLRLATLPSEEDWSPGLPSVLGPLSGLMRPLRLVRKYGAAPASPGESVAAKKASN
jgi:Uncharacterised nucleotidyltransferase